MTNDNDALMLIDALQTRYVCALDGRDLAAWLDCFAPTEASYICLPSEGESQGLPLAIMMDDTPARLRDRARFINSVWAGTFEDYATRHFVQRLRHARQSSGRYAVDSNFMVLYTSARGHSEILVSGSYKDEIDVSSGGAAFVSKRAVLDTVAMPRYLVYPV